MRANKAEACIIFNPAAKGERAQRFRRSLTRLGGACVLKPTAQIGDGRRLAAEAVREGYQNVIAAGGDGTVNEVLNGIGDEPNGFARTCLGVIPIGTMNVFAGEFRLPARLSESWRVVEQHHERRLDLVRVQYVTNNGPAQRYFVQLAGAGIDARAVELVSWDLKKRIGFWAYLTASLAALREPRAQVRVACNRQVIEGQSVLIGNGRFYGGRLMFFPSARADDGRFDVCVYQNTGWRALISCFCAVLLRQRQPAWAVQYLQTDSLELSSSPPVPLELDGEFVGSAPASFSLSPGLLRLLVPNGG